MKYVRTVEELIKHLETLPKDVIVCDADSGNDGVSVDYCYGDKFLIIKGDWSWLSTLKQEHLLTI